jgi:phage/plasmid-associated DNA primase
MAQRLSAAKRLANPLFRWRTLPACWEAAGELPGILNWALAGLDRLRRQECFTRSGVCEQALAKAYRDWCNTNGYSPLADRSFGKEVRRVFPKAQRRELGSRRSRRYVYCGLVPNWLGE